jgi:hypothetical protein
VASGAGPAKAGGMTPQRDRSDDHTAGRSGRFSGRRDPRRRTQTEDRTAHSQRFHLDRRARGGKGREMVVGGGFSVFGGEKSFTPMGRMGN